MVTEAALMTFSSHFTVDGLLASLLEVISGDITTAIFSARFQTANHYACAQPIKCL